ncbi:MAG: hypothetical protein Q8N46_10190, partial [Anaerolineales bacterium]|nr:hypothetical protein [Anaerolineales bacterium]
MSNINPSNSSKSIAKIILILVGIAAIWFLVSLVNNRIDNTLNPLQQMNHELGTQVANLLHPTPTIIPDP